MKLELNTFERLLLLNALPEKGDLVTLRIVRDLRGNLSFSDAEIKRLKFTTNDDGTQTSWDPKGDLPKEFDFGESTMEFIKKSLTKLFESEEATPAHLEVYEKLGFE